MPTVSKKQERFMQAVAHNPAFAKKVGVPVKVGKEFTKSGGGEMKESKAMVKKEIGFMKKKGAPKSMIKHEMKEAGMKKMASGGLAAGHKAADGIAKKGKTKGKEVKMALGGMAKGVAASMQGAAKKAVASKTAPKQMQFMSNALRGGAMKPPTGGMMGAGQRGLGGMPMKPSGVAKMPMVPGTQRGIGSQMASKPQMDTSKMGGIRKIAGLGAAVAGKMMGKKAGGLAAGHKEADGIAKKGKTKAMQVKMAGGGKTKKYC